MYRINGSLVQQEVLQFPSGTSVLQIVLSSDESRLIVCVSNNSCISYIAHNLTKGSVSVFQNILASSNNIALVSAPVIGGGNSFYVGSSNWAAILIGQYGLDGTAGSVSRSSGSLFGVTSGWFTRSWFGGFAAGSYMYFVVLDVNTSPTAMRVLRVCDNSNETSVAAMYEAEIDCFSSGVVDEASTVVGVSLLESFSSGGATFVIGLVTPNAPPLSRVCTVGLSSVDSAMDTASCSGTSLPWRDTVSTDQTCPDSCNIPSPGAVEAPTPLYSNVDIFSISFTDTYTSTLAFNYESFALLFIAYTIIDTTQSFLQAVSVEVK